ncbi:MAG: hypothetical protein Q4D23_01285 [Bacteroidales bacterium]|nr:hypothetical protein [Bacteroidales bacterium]
MKTLCLGDGSRLTNQLLQFDSVGRLCSYEPLTAEQPFCEWFRGEWVAE